jgi:hypothetical protein
MEEQLKQIQRNEQKRSFKEREARP